MKKHFLTFLILAKIVFFSYSQNKDSIQLFDIKLDSLVKIKIISHSSKISTNPTTLTSFNLKIIKNKQIKYSGAFDLLEIFRTAPNIQITSDANKFITLTFNGLWSKNGRILLLYDGHPLNFNLFGNLTLFRHYPVNNLKNIVFNICCNSLYNFNELTAIKINTINYTKQFFISTNTEFSLKTFPLTENFDLAFNRPLTKNLHLSLYLRNQYNYWQINSLKINNTFFHLNILNKDTKFSVLFDKYQRQDSTNLTNQNNFHKYFMTFSSYFDKYKYITPKFAVRLHILFQVNWPDANYLTYFYDINFDKQNYPKLFYIKYVAQADYYKQKNLRLCFSFTVDNHTISPQNSFSITPGVQKKSFITQTYFFNTTIHYKLDKFLFTPNLALIFTNSGSYLAAPRLSVILSLDKFKIEQIFAKTFRMPTIGDLVYAYQQPLASRTDILQPESFILVTNQIIINPNSNLTFSLSNSYINSHNAKNYYFTNAGKAVLLNTGKFGSLSIEASLDYVINIFDIYFSLASYRPIIADKLQLHSIAGTADQYLGSSNFKFTNSFLINFNHAKLFLSTIYIDKKYGYYLKSDGTIIPELFDPTFIISPNIIYYFNKFEINLSVYNLLNSQDYFLQPYKGDFEPLQYFGRTFRFGIKYKF